MNFKHLLISLSCLFVLNGCSQSNKLSNKNKSNANPNILFILSEDMSTDLECYGMPGVKTPVLNNLAETGTQFMKAYGNNSICSPSRSNMMTGVHQNIINAQHHRSNRNIPLIKPFEPITSLLRKAGYTCIIGNDIVKSGGKKIDVNFKHQRVGKWDGETEFGLFDKQGSFEIEDQPFFAQVTLNVTHRGGWWKNISNNSAHKVNPSDIELPPYIADTQVVREDWARYLDQIEFMDAEVGLLLADLEAKGMKENTIIIFIGDNGRCNIRGKGYMYEPGLHLPLIVNWPAGLNGGKKDTRLVASIDVAATILESAGVSLPDYMTARSIIEEDKNPRAYIYSARDLWDEILEQSRAITTQDFRYIKNNIPNQAHDAHQAYLEFYRPAVHIMRSLKEKDSLNDLQLKFFSAKEPEELYDIVNDPHETTNLINHPEYKAVADKMRAHYDHWNNMNHDFGFDPINWENCPPPNASAVIKWLEKERPEVLKKMKAGIEPGFGKLVKEYKEQLKTN